MADTNEGASAIRLVVSDVDGTLVDKDKRLTDGTIAAVKRLREAGIAFTVISARPMSGIQPLLEPLELDDSVRLDVLDELEALEADELEVSSTDSTLTSPDQNGIASSPEENFIIVA